MKDEFSILIERFFRRKSAMNGRAAVVQLIGGSCTSAGCGGWVFRVLCLQRFDSGQ
jgi:hypothetical protein